jgi:hypothetical protein
MLRLKPLDYSRQLQVFFGKSETHECQFSLSYCDTHSDMLHSTLSNFPDKRAFEEWREHIRLHGFTIHSQNVFSIAYKNSSIPNPAPLLNGAHWIERDYFNDKKHEFYYWQDEKPFTHAKSELCSINLAIYGQPDYRERHRYENLIKCLGNERFLVKYITDRFEVYCFDKYFSLAAESKAYREERDRRAAERSKKRQQRADEIAQR